MLSKEDRLAIDKEALDLMLKEIEYAMPPTNSDIQKAFYEGQKTMIYKIEQMIIGHFTGMGFLGVVTEDQIEELSKEVSNATEQTGS